MDSSLFDCFGFERVVALWGLSRVTCILPLTHRLRIAIVKVSGHVRG